MDKRSRCLAGVLATLLLAAPAAGDDVFHRWINPQGGNLRDADNWDQDDWPNWGDTAVFDLDATYTASVVDNPSIFGVRGLRVLSGDVTLDMLDRRFIVSDADADRAIVSGDPASTPTLRVVGQLRVDGGGDAELRVADEEGSAGNLVLDGEHGFLNRFAPVHVGYAGTGTMLLDHSAVSSGSYPLILGTMATGHGTLTVRRSEWDGWPGGIADGARGEVVVGGQGTGILIVEDGGYAEVTVVGRDAGSVGSVTVGSGDPESTEATVWIDRGAVGLKGQGTILVQDGGYLRTGSSFTDRFDVGGAAGSEGSVVVRGSHAEWSSGPQVNVGFYLRDEILHTGGQGSIIVEQGGYARGFDWHIGRAGGSQGTVLIRDAGSSMTGRYLFLGGAASPPPLDPSENPDGGGGTVRVENGGHLRTTRHAYLGFDGGTTNQVIIQGAGSHWDARADPDTGFHARLLIGWAGVGELTIKNAGFVESDGTSIALVPTGQGTATVRDPGSAWVNRDDMRIGGVSSPAGIGQVHVEQAARLHAGYHLHLWHDQATLSINTGGAASVGSLDDPADLDLLPDDTLHVNEAGHVSGEGAITVATFANAGAVTAGLARDEDAAPAPGTLSLAGSYQQHAAGELNVAIDQQGHSLLDVTGSATLAGTLAVDIVGDPAGIVGQSSQVLAASSVDGQFDGVLAIERDDLYVETLYTSQGVAVTPGLVGDMNRDGVVDTGDVAPFVLALTDPAAYVSQHGVDPALAGDVNGDGVFDTGDVAPFVAMLVQSDAAVPEPASLTALVLAAALLWRRRLARTSSADSACQWSPPASHSIGQTFKG